MNSLGIDRLVFYLPRQNAAKGAGAKVKVGGQVLALEARGQVGIVRKE